LRKWDLKYNIMMDKERQTKEYKSLQKIRTGDKGFRDLSVTCVAFANAQGGNIYIGYDDKTCRPLPNQKVDTDEVNSAVTKLRSLCFNVALAASEIMHDDADSQYFIINVFPSLRSIASTSDGKFYIRVGDKCEPVRSEDIQRLANEKQAFQWELVCTKNYKLTNTAPDALQSFSDKIRKSERVSDHIKQMSDHEIAENYNLVDGDYLTYLGILWLGNAMQRSRISYPITVQYIVYDSLDRKVRKKDWHDNLLNPAELLVDIEREAVELKYFYEFPNGLFRKQIYHYHPKVLRELLLNAFAHKSFTISGDIMIEVYPDRLEISNPGGLPLGVTKDNILHQRQRRNPHFIRIMHDIGLMEGEGSGYDLIYELNARDAKPLPDIESDFNYTKVIQYSQITNTEVIGLLDYVLHNYELSQKDIIALGLVARTQKILSTELTSLLQLPENERMRSYVDRLLKQHILITRGIKKGTEFLINPRLISNAKLNVKTTLKTMEPYALEALIREDLRIHPDSRISDISKRLPDVALRDLRKFVYAMANDGTLEHRGGRTFRTYTLSQGKT
jgi:ATP-dependent DNA helicase RecG